MKLVNILNLFLLLSAAPFANVSADTISFRADTWYPMNGVPDSPKPGYIIEIAQKIFASRRHVLDYQTMAWTQALLDVKSGKADCVVGAYKEDAPDFIFTEEPFGKDTQAFYVRYDQLWRFQGDLLALDKISIGIIGNYSYGAMFDSYIKQVEAQGHISAVTADNGLEINFRKLMSGKIVATLDSVAVADNKISEMGLEGKIINAGLLGEPQPMYIACSPEKSSSLKYTQLLSEGIRTMRANGELKTILDKYDLSDWK